MSISNLSRIEGTNNLISGQMPYFDALNTSFSTLLELVSSCKNKGKINKNR